MNSNANATAHLQRTNGKMKVMRRAVVATNRQETVTTALAVGPTTGCIAK